MKAEITGQRFNRLTAVERRGSNKRGEAVWLFRCDCGNDTLLVTSVAISGRTKSCGCLGSELRVLQMTKHGFAGSIPEYATWASMRKRCNNQRCTDYANYGGRGITVCARWDDFLLFLADMGPRPPGTSIDRIDNNGNYEPGNCRWATTSEQNANRRPHKNALWLEHNGERKTLRDWARVVGINYKTLSARLTHGWPADKALTTPARSRT